MFTADVALDFEQHCEKGNTTPTFFDTVHFQYEYMGFSETRPPQFPRTIIIFVTELATWLPGYVLGYHGSPHFETNSSIIKGSLEVKLPTIWTDEKQRWEESEKRREEKRRPKKRKSQKKEDAGARKGRKVAKH